MMNSIRTFVRARQTGKTTEVKRRMYADTKLYLIVPSYWMKKIYPKDLHSRIFSGSSIEDLYVKTKGMHITKVILDEGFMYRKDHLAKLYYYLGYYHIEVDSIGTIDEPIFTQDPPVRAAEYNRKQFEQEYTAQWQSDSFPVRDPIIAEARAEELEIKLRQGLQALERTCSVEELGLTALQIERRRRQKDFLRSEEQREQETEEHRPSSRSASDVYECSRGNDEAQGMDGGAAGSGDSTD
jgi:hypothetical protein